MGFGYLFFGIVYFHIINDNSISFLRALKASTSISSFGCCRLFGSWWLLRIGWVCVCACVWWIFKSYIPLCVRAYYTCSIIVLVQWNQIRTHHIRIFIFACFLRAHKRDRELCFVCTQFLFFISIKSVKIHWHTQQWHTLLYNSMQRITPVCVPWNSVELLHAYKWQKLPSNSWQNGINGLNTLKKGISHAHHSVWPGDRSLALAEKLNVVF